MTYSVHYEVSLEAIPEDALKEIVRIMQQIAEAVSTMPDSSPLWGSLNDSPLQIVVNGWRVLYGIAPRRREIHVVEIEPTRR